MEKPLRYVINVKISDPKNFMLFFKELYKIDSNPFEIIKLESYAIKSWGPISDIFNLLAPHLSKNDILFIGEIRTRPKFSSNYFEEWWDD